MGYFSTRPVVINSSTPKIDIDAVIANYNSQIDNSRGGSYQVDRIMKFVISIKKFRPLHGSTCIPTPPVIEKRKCTINVKNKKDNKCFLWSLVIVDAFANSWIDCMKLVVCSTVPDILGEGARKTR